MHLLPEGLDCLNTISTDNSRPIRSHDYTTQKCHIAKRCGKQGPVADVSVRLFSAFMKVSSFQEENQSKNSIFNRQYRLFRCQKVSSQPRRKKKAQKKTDFDRLWRISHQNNFTTKKLYFIAFLKLIYYFLIKNYNK